MKKVEFMDYELTSIPNNNYQKLFNKFKKIDSLPVAEWKKPEILGYFCKKYFDFYQTNYIFKFNTPIPSKCFEIWQISALAGKLSSDAQLLKDYIDWCFKEVVPKAKRKLTSISFLNKEDVLTFYKLNVLTFNAQNKIQRSSELPEKYKQILLSKNLKINNYGELAFLYTMTNAPSEVLIAIQELEQLGLNKSVMENII